METQEDLVLEARRFAWKHLAIIVERDLDVFPVEVCSLAGLRGLDVGGLHTHVEERQQHTIGSAAHKYTFRERKGITYHEIDDPSEFIGRLSQLPDLETLQIVVWGARTTFKSIPPEVRGLRNLDYLGLRHSSLSAVPAGLSGLASLTNLDLSSNQIRTFASDLGELKALVRLSLSGNELADVPDDLGKLVGLRRLYLSDNRLSAVPSAVYRLKNLESLDLSGNQITRISDAIGELTNLKRLSIRKHANESDHAEHSGNGITQLPTTIRKLERLSQLDLRGNPFTTIPAEILEKIEDPQFILAYYFDRKKRPLRELKLLVVGQGGVGKSSLVQRLLAREFDQRQPKTEGIAISPWHVDVAYDQAAGRNLESEKPTLPIRVNIWDFGGQEIMHATHQFFLTKRSLYLLVLDSRLTQEENRVEYWLKMIQSFGADSPVLIVGNKVDQHPLDVDRTGLKKKYENIVEIVETSAATGAGVGALQGAIAKQSNALPHVHDLLPDEWFEVKARIEDLGRSKSYLTYDDYLALCARNGVTDSQDHHNLIGFLHDLGVVLHFQDDPYLEALGILNPQWVTNGVYKILNSHRLFHSQGELTVPMLAEILDSPEYPRDKRIFIVEMMRKFELCYDVESNRVFLVPDLLPKDEPYTGDWSAALAFQYKYNVLPSSVITRFIVRMKLYVHKTVWRSGVVLSNGKNTALVKADAEEKKVSVWVDGEKRSRREFLAAIRSELDAIHKTIPRIEVQQRVPLPGRAAVTVDYEHLRRLEQKGVATLIPEGADEEASVSSLLDGVVAAEERLRVTTDNVSSELLTRNSVSRLLPVQRRGRYLAYAFYHPPRVLGRIVLDICGRDGAAETTCVVAGYALVVVVAGLAWGVWDLDTLSATFASIWKSLFPSE